MEDGNRLFSILNPPSSIHGLILPIGGSLPHRQMIGNSTTFSFVGSNHHWYSATFTS